MKNKEQEKEIDWDDAIRDIPGCTLSKEDVNLDEDLPNYVKSKQYEEKSENSKKPNNTRQKLYDGDGNLNQKKLDLPAFLRRQLD